MSDIWPTVHAERAALIEDLSGIAEGRWDEPSLCAGWTVHDVAAHLVDTARTTRTGFILAMLRARMDFDRLNDQGVQRHRGRTPAETLAGLREVATRTSTPPAPLDSRLVEEIVHGEDIRRPLGLQRRYPAAAVARAVHLQTRTSAALGGAKELVTRVRLVADDADLEIGAGPEVTGSTLSLLLAVCGRRPTSSGLSGPGMGELERS